MAKALYLENRRNDDLFFHRDTVRAVYDVARRRHARPAILAAYDAMSWKKALARTVRRQMCHVSS